MLGPTLTPRPSPARLLVPALVGAAVALGLGLYGRVHDPTGKAIPELFFSGVLNLKVWFATTAVALALVQLLTSLWLYGRLPLAGRAPHWLSPVHRLTGLVAFLLTVPVAYQCLWSLGFQDTTTRVLVHSVAGCFFFGAFAAKVVIVHSRRLPGWALPLAGGTVFAVLVLVWLTSALWFFRNTGFPQF